MTAIDKAIATLAATRDGEALSPQDRRPRLGDQGRRTKMANHPNRNRQATWPQFVAAEPSERRAMILALPTWLRALGYAVSARTPVSHTVDYPFRLWSLRDAVIASSTARPPTRRERAAALAEWRREKSASEYAMHPVSLAADERWVSDEHRARALAEWRRQAGKDLVYDIRKIRRLKSEPPRPIALGGQGGSHRYAMVDATAAHLATARLDLARTAEHLSAYRAMSGRLAEELARRCNKERAPC